ncbi:hypothetical protein HU200_062977 [Digitaria exilis]|uniref:Uncharacterized protein n=1 Tax=Digitaria exilis TaxID=1010633 RepID=A0A835DWP2_9POAL|nr:hypothetical protein HU200_062977 [Digitaria exilis]
MEANNGGLGKNIDRMFKDAITAGKRVRCQINISSGAVSVNSAAVELALMKLPKTEALSARKMKEAAVKLAIKHLIAKGVQLRSPEECSACVSEVGSGRVYNVDDLKEVVEANKEDWLRKASELEKCLRKIGEDNLNKKMRRAIEG